MERTYRRLPSRGRVWSTVRSNWRSRKVASAARKPLPLYQPSCLDQTWAWDLCDKISVPKGAPWMQTELQFLYAIYAWHAQLVGICMPHWCAVRSANGMLQGAKDQHYQRRWLWSRKRVPCTCVLQMTLHHGQIGYHRAIWNAIMLLPTWLWRLRADATALFWSFLLILAFCMWFRAANGSWPWGQEFKWRLWYTVTQQYFGVWLGTSVQVSVHRWGLLLALYASQQLAWPSDALKMWWLPVITWGFLALGWRVACSRGGLG